MIVISKGKPVAIIKKISEDEIAEVEDYVLSHHPKFKSMIEDAYSEFLEGKTIPIDKVISKIGSKNAKSEPHYELKVGDYRIVYRIEDQDVIVAPIVHRKNLLRALREIS